MSTGTAIAVAVTFVWLGMVLAISFLEAPLKFRAPNVTLQIGLGIGRLVFRALNTVEVGFALVILAIVMAGPTPARIAVAFFVAFAALAIQARVGTRLAACPEALTGDGGRRALIAARATDTTVTRVFDVARGLPWPARFPSRVLANDFVARWIGKRMCSTSQHVTS
jgi:hypothetical protein